MSLLRCLPIAAAVSLLLLAARPSSAQAPASPTTTSEVRELDISDIWRAIRKKPAPAVSDEPPRRILVVAPVIGAKPDTGFLFGAAGNLAFYRGDPKTTNLSTSVLSLTFSTKKQTLGSAKFAAYGKDNRWLVEGDNRLNWTSQDIFALGTPSANEPVNAHYDFFRVYENMYRRVASHTYAGGGLVFNTHVNIEPSDEVPLDLWNRSPHVVYSEQHGLPTDSATSGGLNVGIRIDSRDNQIRATRGSFASATYRAYFDGFLGGDSSWQQISFDTRTYRALTPRGRQTLAAWVFGDFVVDGAAPYFDLPATGMDTFGRSGRGYKEGRFRGERLVYGELEYRTTLTRNELFGMVGFINATTVSASDTGAALFDSVAIGSGFGARVLLSKRSRTNLCFDVGWGRDGSKGVYLSVQEAF
jgi:hypothetical protein